MSDKFVNQSLIDRATSDLVIAYEGAMTLAKKSRNLEVKKQAKAIAILIKVSLEQLFPFGSETAKNMRMDRMKQA